MSAADAIDFAAMFRERVGEGPYRDAIVSSRGAISFAELAERVFAAAAAIADRDGVGTVGVSIADETDHLVAALALICRSVPQVTLPAHQPAATKLELARLAGATHLIADNASGWAADAGIKVLAWPLPHRPVGSTSHLSGRFAADAPVFYRTTSGTTGTPKAFGMSARFVARAIDRIHGDPWQRRLLRTSTMDFDSTKVARVTTILAGHCCVFADDLGRTSLARLCHAADVTDVHMGTHRLKLLVAEGGAAKLPATTRVLAGGSRVPGALRMAAKALTDTLWVSYATSEVGVVSFATPEQHAAFPEGVGFPIPGVTVKILAADGAELPPGEVGLARIAKAGLPEAYLAGPDGGPSLEHGWFHSNDLLSQPDGGPLIFHGRADDVMLLGGLKIFPGPIEDALERHSDVREAVAYPVRSRIHGDIPVAAVVLRSDASASERDLMRHCRTLVGVYGPRRIFIVDAIPRTDTGKPVRRLLPSG